MEQALQRVATGAWLEMPAIAWQGLNVATNTMTWDTLPTALEFGLAMTVAAFVIEPGYGRNEIPPWTFA